MSYVRPPPERGSTWPQCGDICSSKGGFTASGDVSVPWPLDLATMHHLTCKRERKPCLPGTYRLVKRGSPQKPALRPGSSNENNSSAHQIGRTSFNVPLMIQAHLLRFASGLSNFVNWISNEPQFELASERTYHHGDFSGSSMSKRDTDTRIRFLKPCLVCLACFSAQYFKLECIGDNFWTT